MPRHSSPRWRRVHMPGGTPCQRVRLQPPAVLEIRQRDVRIDLRRSDEIRLGRLRTRTPTHAERIRAGPGPSPSAPPSTARARFRGLRLRGFHVFPAHIQSPSLIFQFPSAARIHTVPNGSSTVTVLACRPGRRGPPKPRGSPACAKNVGPTVMVWVAAHLRRESSRPREPIFAPMMKCGESSYDAPTVGLMKSAHSVVFEVCTPAPSKRLGHQVQTRQSASRAGSSPRSPSSSCSPRFPGYSPTVDRQLIRSERRYRSRLLDPVEGKGGFDARRLLKNEIPREFEMVRNPVFEPSAR